MSKEIKNRIIDSAMEQFFTYGFRSITMDDVAVKLGMSKRTIYKHFPGKEVLLKEVIDKKRAEIENQMETLVSGIDKDDTDIMEMIKSVIGYMKDQIREIKPPFILDLERISPELISYIEDFRLNLIKDYFGRIIHEGMRRGIIRDDIKDSVLVDIYYNMIRILISSEIIDYHHMDSIELADTIVKIFFEGVLTEEGRAKYT
jgi:AcrR family transcriptional regulator